MVQVQGGVDGQRQLLDHGRVFELLAAVGHDALVDDGCAAAGGGGGGELDVLVREGVSFGRPDGEQANDIALDHHWRQQQRTRSPAPWEDARRVFATSPGGGGGGGSLPVDHLLGGC